MLWLYLIMMALSGYRLTVLVVRDTFPPVLWLRDRVVGGWRPLTDKEWSAVRAAGRGEKPFHTQSLDFGGARGEQEARWIDRKPWVPYWLAELMSCPWCASGWIALALACAGAAQGFYGWPVAWMVWGSVWAFSALLAAKDGAS
jgi:hypothetical protein